MSFLNKILDFLAIHEDASIGGDLKSDEIWFLENLKNPILSSKTYSSFSRVLFIVIKL